MSHTTTIQLKDLQLVAAAYRLRRYSKGHTAQLAAFTRAPMVEVDCSQPRRGDKYRRENAANFAHRCAPTVSPLRRGHITELIERTRWMHGLAELRTTWRAGIRALLAEDRHLLKGGSA